MAIPKTSTTLLRAIGSTPQSVRWTEFVKKYESFMTSVVRSYCPNINDDEMSDVLQNILIKLMRILPDYQYDPDAEGKGHFRNYLNGVCRNTAYEFVRKRERLNDRFEFRSDVEFLHNEDGEGVEEGEDIQSSDVEDMLVENWRGEKSAYEQWQKSVLEVALQQLMAASKISQQNKEIFRLLAVTGEKSPEEVAGMFNITRNNVDQIKNRMMGKLKTLAHKLKHLDLVEDKM